MFRTIRADRRHALVPRLLFAAVASVALGAGSFAFADPDGGTIVSGSFTQGGAAASANVGTGSGYDVATNSMNDFPLNTGDFGGVTYPINFANGDYYSSVYGGNAGTMIAFGNGGGVTLQMAQPITPNAGEKDLGIFTTQTVNLYSPVGALFEADMQANILVSQDGVHFYTLSGTPVSETYTNAATASHLNAPSMAYVYGDNNDAYNDGYNGIVDPVTLPLANYTTPMPDDSLFNDPASTDDERSAALLSSDPAVYDEMWGTSAGGNWFDISGSGLSQVDYVRLNGIDDSGDGVILDSVFANANAVPEPAGLGILAFSLLLVKRRRGPAAA
jgi:hypothetical protein